MAYINLLQASHANSWQRSFRLRIENKSKRKILKQDKLKLSAAADSKTWLKFQKNKLNSEAFKIR